MVNLASGISRKIYREVQGGGGGVRDPCMLALGVPTRGHAQWEGGRGQGGENAEGKLCFLETVRLKRASLGL